MKKRVLAIVCVVALVFCLTACSALTPKMAVTNYCKAMRELDSEAMKACLTAGAAGDSLTVEDIPAEAAFMAEQIKVWAKDTTMKVIETRTEGNTATVTAYFTYKNASPVVTETLKEYVLKAFTAAFTGGDSSMALLEEIFNGKAQTAALETTDATITFTCMKLGNEGWKISNVPNELYDVATCNVTYGLGALADAFG